MKILVTESQLKNILLKEYYDSEKLYNRERIVNMLSKAPKYIREYVKNLPHIECTDQDGNSHICTKLPQVVYEYLFGGRF